MAQAGHVQGVDDEIFVGMLGTMAERQLFRTSTVSSGYGRAVTIPAPHRSGGEPTPPAADPVAIRACLSPRLVAEFDAEWERTLEQAKASKDLVGVHKLLNKWRHVAYGEMRDPGSYFRVLAKAEQIMQTGENPTAGSFEDMQALIRERLGR